MQDDNTLDIEASPISFPSINPKELHWGLPVAEMLEINGIKNLAIGDAAGRCFGLSDICVVEAFIVVDDKDLISVKDFLTANGFVLKAMLVDFQPSDDGQGMPGYRFSS